MMRQLQQAFRRLCRTPVFTVGALLTLAITIGATAAVFSVVNGVLLKRFPFRDVDRVLVVYEANPGLGFPGFAVSPANYLDWRSQNTTFSMLALTSATLEITNERQFTVSTAAEPERLRGLTVTPNYFPTLGITPALGRPLAADSAGPAEVLISYGYWQRRFGGSGRALNQKLVIDNQPYTIVGVMPAGLPGDIDLWMRLSLTGGLEASRSAHGFVVFGRLKPGVPAEAARKDLETIASRLAAAYPKSNKGWTVFINPLLDELVGDIRSPLILLLGAAACVLLIGAANLANLFLVRYLARARELAVRTAMGATRRRLAGELLTEATALGIVAGVIGVGVAVVGVRILRTLAPSSFPRLGQVTVDGRVVAFCALISITTVLIFGALPAWQTSRENLADVLKEGGRGTGSAQRHRLQDGLAILQVAVALVLLTGATLLVESFVHLQREDPGFRPDGVLTARIALRQDRYPTPERQRAFIETVVEQLAAQPGVDAASASSFIPVGDPPILGFTIIGDPPLDPDHVPETGFGFVTPGYFRTLGIRLEHGRLLQSTDDARATKAVVVDDLLAHKFFGGSDPVGRQVTVGPDTAQIVGEVTTVKEGPLAVPDLPHMYISTAQVPFPIFTIRLAVHTAGDPIAETPRLRRLIATLDPSVPVYEVRTMSELLAQSIGTTRFSTVLASLFAVIALTLGVVGIYSVLAYIVTQRQREIAVRIALGAPRAQVMADVLAATLRLSAIGIALGLVLAWVLTRALTNLLAGVGAHDPATFVGAAVVFAVVALLAAVIPALRTIRVNPVVVLASS